MRKDCFSFLFIVVVVFVVLVLVLVVDDVVVAVGVAVVFISNPSMRIRTNSFFVNPAAHIAFFFLYLAQIFFRFQM